MSSFKAPFITLLAGALLVAALAPLEADAANRKSRKPAESKTSQKSKPKPKPSGATVPTAPQEAAPEEADVEKIKQKYWARGNEAAVGVVQNRLFTKERKFEFDLTLGTVHGDPFLTTTTVTGSAGYHFSEFFSAHLSFAKALVSPSSALTTLEQQLGTTANTNEPKYFVAGEGRASLLYGKVSLLGSAILYFDAYFSGGLAYLSTESGGVPMVLLGIGQQIHITRSIGLNLAYKILWYRETILGKVSGVNGNLGQNLGTRSNLSNTILVGLTFLLDPLSRDEEAKP